jgi:hypothetical protein
LPYLADELELAPCLPNRNPLSLANQLLPSG